MHSVFYIHVAIYHVISKIVLKGHRPQKAVDTFSHSFNKIVNVNKIVSKLNDGHKLAVTFMSYLFPKGHTFLLLYYSHFHTYFSRQWTYMLITFLNQPNMHVNSLIPQQTPLCGTLPRWRYPQKTHACAQLWLLILAIFHKLWGCNERDHSQWMFTKCW